MCVCLQFLVGRVFANGLGNLGSIPGCVIPKTLKMVLDTSLLNTQYVSRVKWSNPGVVAIEKGAFWSLSTTVAIFTLLFIIYITFFELQLRFLFIIKVFLESFKVYDCPIIILQTQHFFIFTFIDCVPQIWKK